MQGVMLPSGEQAATTPTWSATGATTLRSLSTTERECTDLLSWCYGWDCRPIGLYGNVVSDPIAANTTVGGGTIVLLAAESEGFFLAANFCN